MYSSTYIWAKVLGHMEQQLTPAVVSTWFDDTEVLELTDQKLVLFSPSTFRKDMIVSRCAVYIQEALKDLFDMELELIVLDETQIDAYRSRKKKPRFIEFNPQFTFDNFIVGNSNRVATAVAKSIAAAPAQKWNPFYIYGGSGLGKTHLMHAIGHELLKNFPNMRLLCITSEDFVNEFIQCIQDKNTESFRRRYRNVDVLFVDDIQFLGRGDKESSKEEFFHTFNKLYQDKKQMVFTSDRPPRDIKKLEERLRSRFENGMVTQIEPPDLETRTAILRAWAEKENITCDLDALNYIAANVSENIRKLHGAFIRVLLEASQSKSNVTLPLVKHAIHYITDAQDEKKYITIDEITTYICQHYNINYKELMGKKKTKDIALPRQIAMYMCRELTGNTYPHIGTAFNGRDHTTVMHACSQIRKKIDKDSHFKEHLEKMMNEIRGVDN